MMFTSALCLATLACVTVPAITLTNSRVRRQEDESFWWLTPEEGSLGGSLTDSGNAAEGFVETNSSGDLPLSGTTGADSPGFSPVSGGTAVDSSRDLPLSGTTGADSPGFSPFSGGTPLDSSRDSLAGGSLPPINDLLDLAGLFGEGAVGGGPCECVVYYQCKEGDIVTNGDGLIDIRFGNTLNATGTTRLNSHSQCPNFLDVCCRSPDTSVTPIPGPVDDSYRAKCGTRNPTGVNARVSGFTATQSQYGEFPWMAAILQTEYVGSEEVNLYVCGGALIYPDVILTAAHCVQSWRSTPDVLKARLGEWDTQRTYELYTHVDRRVSRVVTHELYNAGSLSNDYALLLLESPFVLSPHIDTICLPDRHTSIDSSKCFVTGWGKNEFGKEGQFQNILKKVSLPLVTHADCETALRTTRLGKHFRLHSTFTCAGGGPDGSDACKGDGGSPLVCPLRSDPLTYVQVGIVAWGIGCGEPGIPGVYADVSKGVAWIQQQLSTLPYTHSV